MSHLLEASALDLDGCDINNPDTFPAKEANNFEQLTDFSLLQTDPSQAQGPSEIDNETLEVLSRARALVDTDCILLSNITPHLSRFEAAKMFHHILGKYLLHGIKMCSVLFLLQLIIIHAVGTTKGFINSAQEVPYGDICVTFQI